MKKNEKLYEYMDSVMDYIQPGMLLSPNRKSESNLARLELLWKRTKRDSERKGWTPQKTAEAVKRGIKLFKI